jgi:mannose-6-phosphate isomerase-like protein (cupin superfamily)
MEIGKEFHNPATGTRVTILEDSSQRLAMRRTLPPGTGKADAHRHLDYVETFVIEEGIATVKVGKDVRTAAAGETIRLEHDTGHANPYNEGSEPLTFLHSVEPSNPFVRAYVATWVVALERGELNEQDEFSALQLFPVLAATKARSYVVGPPIAAQKLVIPVVAAIGRARGNRAVVPQPEVSVSSSVSSSPSSSSS